MDRASLLVGLAAAALGRAPAATAQAGAPPAATPAAARTVALVNGQWFNGRAFEPRTVYSVAGRFTATRPARVDTTVELAGTWVVPPFGEAHNHNVDGVVEGRTRAALAHGYEASFLALGGDPLADIANVRQIRLRFKQGVLLGR